MTEKSYIKYFQLTVISASGLLIVALVSAWMLSGPLQEWRKIQGDYEKLSKTLSDSVSEFQSYFNPGEILQYELNGLNRTDRCITCHLGIENPEFKQVEQPFGTHPGTFLEDHPIEKYGCTICHEGQGRALNTKDAHGIEPSTHWNSPILMGSYLQSACGKCHLSIYDENSEFTGAEVFQKGHEIFSKEGCLGCHKARGLGGIVGPDLSEQGEKTRQEYNFQNVRLEQTVSNWMKEHFRDPEMVSPGSQMLKVDLPEKDIEALTTFVLGLAKPDISFEYFSLPALNEFKGNRKSLRGQEVFSLICSACHGKDGSGKSYEDYKTGVPAIFGEDFLRVVSKDFIEFTLLSGRSNRQMASWMPQISGLSGSEIHELSDFIKTRRSIENITFRISSLDHADASEGKELFNEHCATCHGNEGKGGISIALNRRDFLKNAEDEYLFNTLINGRGNATMPSWINLQDQNLYDIVKYLRSFQVYKPDETSIKFVDPDIVQGKLKFHFLCSRCHGDAGQGQTGPAIINSDFLKLASDEFLYNTISSGREHTAMFGWSTDVYNAERLEKKDIGNIISFIREEASKRPEYIYAGRNPGDKLRGDILFKEHCSKCHGVNAEGEKAPALNNQELLSAASNGYLMATITIGRSGTAMPAWGKETMDHGSLSGNERQDIVAWLRSKERIRIAY